MELKKVATSGGSPDRSMSGRFPSFKSTSYKKDSNTNGKGTHRPLFSKRGPSEAAVKMEKYFSERYAVFRSQLLTVVIWRVA